MRMIVFEGSPDEVSQVLKNMQGAAIIVPEDAPVSSSPAGPVKTQDGPSKFVTPEFAHAQVTRIPLSVPMTAVLTTLYEADREWVSSARLYEVSGYSVAQFAGLMGAFGRRMAHTPGYDEEAHFFDYRWNEETKAWDYRLPPSVRSALKSAGIV